MWLVVSLAGYSILVAVAILDKFILNKVVSKPAVFVFYSTIFILPLALLIPFGVGFLNGSQGWNIAILSGITFGFGLWVLYAGFRESEISHAGPLLGAAVALFVVILGRFFLAEIISPRELLAIGVLILGSLIISFERSRRHNGWHRGMFLVILASGLFAVSHVSAKYIYDQYGFYSGFVWTRLPTCLVGLMLLISPKVRREIFSKKKSPDGRGKKIFLVGTNKFLAIVGIGSLQYATAIGSVSLVNALAGVQYAILIIAVAFLSKFAPRLFKEDYGRIEILQEIIAIIFIGIGLVLLV